MIKKIPVAASPVTLRDLYEAFFPKDKAKEDFETKLKLFVESRNVFLTNSGTAAFYMILKSLKKLSSHKDEVILPAYTAPVLVVVVRKAGLKPILVDISLEDFNLDVDLLDSAVSKNTLCIAMVHMFGIPAVKIDVLKDRFKDVFIVEDCAQAMGSQINERAVGTSGNCSFFSFNRGKNLPTYGGGAVVTDSQRIADVLKNETEKLEEDSVFLNSFIPLKILLFSLAIKPLVYGGFYPLISLFKSDSVPQDFRLKRYSNYQASAGSSMLENFKQIVSSRYNNGMRIISGLQDSKGLIVPKIKENIKPAFNRLPVVFKDINSHRKAEAKLEACGIETSHMYKRPLHHIFDLGYKKDDFPNATYFAKYLSTLPTHPLLTDNYLDKIIDTIRTSE